MPPINSLFLLHFIGGVKYVSGDIFILMVCIFSILFRAYVSKRTFQFPF